MCRQAQGRRDGVGGQQILGDEQPEQHAPFGRVRSSTASTGRSRESDGTAESRTLEGHDDPFAAPL